MAGRVINYKVFKRLHLYACMIIFVFLSMYCISGIAFMHKFTAFTKDTTTKEIEYKLDTTLAIGQMAYNLRDEFKLGGQFQEPKIQDNGNYRFKFSRPGTSHTVVWKKKKQLLEITTYTESGPGRLLTRFHLLRGYHGGGLYILWAIFVDLSAIALILFAVTGIYMWYKGSRKKIIGFILLISGFIFSAYYIYILMN